MYWTSAYDQSFLNGLSLFKRHETVTRIQKGIKWHDYIEGIEIDSSVIFFFKNLSLSSCICFHESNPIFTVNSQICIDSCQRAMWFLLLLSSRLFSCLASECTCVGTLLPWPRRSTISDCLVSTPQSLSQVMKFSLMPRSLCMFLVCFIIPSDHASVPYIYIFLSHETRFAKKEIIHIP